MAPICANCVTGYRLPGEPTGEMIHIEPTVMEAYLVSKHTKTSEGDGVKKAVVFLTDVFGLPLGNPKIMADEINARVHVDVYVPDMFEGIRLQRKSSRVQLINRPLPTRRTARH